TSECKVLAHPSSVDSIPTDGSKEDVVPMAMGAAWKARRIIDNVRNVLAVELMCGAQGIDFRAPLAPAAAVGRAHKIVRAVVPRLERDRVMSGDINLIAAEILAGKFDACIAWGVEGGTTQ
ncbi:MAG: aromatic amino acid lyase, partial [Gemmatimonadaceae bacterium]